MTITIERYKENNGRVKATSNGNYKWLDFAMFTARRALCDGYTCVVNVDGKRYATLYNGKNPTINAMLKNK